MISPRILAFAGLTLLATVGTAGAQETPQPKQFYSLYQDQDQGPAGAANDMARYDHSGTRGRLDLGASPFHPEGPGNVSD